jgi:hypothetical protein
MPTKSPVRGFPVPTKVGNPGGPIPPEGKASGVISPRRETAEPVGITSLRWERP